MVSQIWVDVEDLLLCPSTGGRRPTGIQRLTFELCQAMHRGVTGSRFVRHAIDRSGLVEIGWDEVAAAFSTMACDQWVPPPEPTVPVVPPPRRGPSQCLPPLFGDFVRAHWRAVLAWPRILWGSMLALSKFVTKPAAQTMETSGEQVYEPELAAIARGDVLFAPGSTWLHKSYAAFVAEAVERNGLQFAILVYDVIPLRRPEWCGRRHTDTFRTWLHEILPQCDTVLAISEHGAADLTHYARSHDIPWRDSVVTIPIGCGFSTNPACDAGGLPERSPPGCDFVLFVSTIEIRKNHQLLLRVWRRLIEQMPEGSVPLLVFAGQIGWMVTDLLTQLENSDFLGGRVVLIHDATDNELATLYRSCLFTVFPSLYEGWGLPVTESLALAKPCIVSRATSLPEAGKTFARYFDPENVTEATSVLRTTIEDRTGLSEWQECIRRDYVPVSWAQSAQAVARILGLQNAGPLSVAYPDAPREDADGFRCSATYPPG